MIHLVSSSSSDLQLAARRLVEFDSIRSKLHDARRSAIDDIERCVQTYRLKYSGRRELRRDLNECEWSIYQYSSLLHMLGELVERTNDEFDTTLQVHAPVKHETPKLIGIRHCIHHNGLIGINIGEPESLVDPIVLVPVQSIKRHGSWGDGNPKFETFFHDVTGAAFALEPVLQNSEEPIDGIIQEIVGQIEAEYGEEALMRAATSVQLYD